MYLEKEMKDLENRNITVSVWVPVRIMFLKKPANECARISMEGYATEADYLAGFTPIETRHIVVPLIEPEEGDVFTALRPIIVATVTDVQSKAIALCKRVAEWEGAVEK